MGLLAQMTWGQWLVGMALLGVCFLLILVVLLQRGRGGGLAGAFGGGGGSSAFGAKTGDVFTWITVVVATIFVGLSVAANFVFDESAPPRAATVQTAVPLETPPSDQTPTPAPQGVEPGVPAGAGTSAPGPAGGTAGAAKPSGTSEAPPAGGTDNTPKDAPPTPAP